MHRFIPVLEDDDSTTLVRETDTGSVNKNGNGSETAPTPWLQFPWPKRQQLKGTPPQPRPPRRLALPALPPRILKPPLQLKSPPLPSARSS